MSDDVFMRNLAAFAGLHGLQLAERLGFGIHGIIHVAGDKSRSGRTAVKVHREREPFLPERAAYERLCGVGLSRILGFNVQQLIRTDDALSVIEMSIVMRPFVLDFAGAYLDQPPEFSDEIWAEWETEKREQFEWRWPTVQKVLAALGEFDIHMVYVSPSNIAFED
ncbi:MAG: hypothetical protein ABIP55_05190 [Tepidisphaeraceae bacterium]